MKNNNQTEVRTTEQIKAFFDARSQVGLQKYGVSMDRDDLTSEEWLTHMIEELADAIQYAWRLRETMQGKKSDSPLPTERMFRPIEETHTYNDLTMGQDVFYKCQERELTAAIIAGFVFDPKDGNLIVIQTGYDWVAVEIHELFEEIK